MIGNRIKLNEALNIYHQVDEHGKEIPFSIQFVKNDGEILNLPNAQKCLLPKHLHQSDYIGVRIPNSANHDYSVHVRTITMFNNAKVWF